MGYNPIMTDTALHTINTLSPLAAEDEEMEAMAKFGVHLGHAKTKDHPTMKGHIFGVRNTISIIDLARTKPALAAAEEFIRATVARGGLILLVGTRPAARTAILEVAARTGMPYFTERWIGGALTNFKVIRKRVEHLETLEKEKASGEFEKYTKKERMLRDEETTRLKKLFDGLRRLTRLPDTVFIVDTTEDTTAVRESRRMRVPVVALCDTNADARVIDYPIPANDDALPAVRYMVGRIGAAIEEGQQEARTQEVKPAA